MQVLAPTISHTQNDALRSEMLFRYAQVRAWTQTLCAPLEAEDYMVQSMADVSPTKWHIAHTSWFFETFLLKPHLPNYQSPHPQYDYLFNSYYNSVGLRHCRANRGLVSRPTVEQTWQYRAHVDENIRQLLENCDESTLQVLVPLLELGLHHEQQHQELMVTDFKHVFAQNPLFPTYREREVQSCEVAPLQWRGFDAGLFEIGHDGSGFAFDNEAPRHKRWNEAFLLANRLTTNGEYLAFMRAGGYEQPQWWLSSGWATVQNENWRAPLYWEMRDGKWFHFTLSGLREVEESEPVCHLSLFEADAFARWSGARLPSEWEWEIAAHHSPLSDASFAESEAFHPSPTSASTCASTCDATSNELQQMLGEVWQWTRSQYEPYPGYAPVEGALGEYNGKFMCNQFVLRGASCATPRSHARTTYRNFFPPESRWQFSGVRLAKDRN